ncbi:MAG: aldo/keto reductase [Anaerolineales bacterium]|nr:aldo/keto reductase [Anaerolineales bacterium]
MEYTNLGRSGLKVSRMCLGTMNFGPQTDEPQSHKIMDLALEFGINFFDTANVYGWQTGEGITEKIIGNWFSLGGGRREKVVIATKVYGKMGEGVNDRRLSAYHIIRSCEDSLKRLQTDRIDLYQMHHIDRETPWEEIWQAMETLVAQGKILYVGSSNFAGWHITQAQCTAKARHFLGLISEQCLFNLNSRDVEMEILPACRFNGIGVIPYSPLGGGLLAGALEKIEKGRRSSERIQRLLEKHRKQLKLYETFCKEFGEHPSNIALAWLLHNPAVTAPIIGPRTEEQLERSIKSVEIVLSDDNMVQLNDIWPGPGGEAPEAFAW